MIICPTRLDSKISYFLQGLNIGNTESAAAKKLLKKSGVANDVIEVGLFISWTILIFLSKSRSHSLQIWDFFHLMLLFLSNKIFISLQTLSSVTAVDNRVRRSVVSSSDAMHMSIEDLETALEDPSRSTDRTTIKKWLLNKYCDSGVGLKVAVPASETRYHSTWNLKFSLCCQLFQIVSLYMYCVPI